MKILFICSLAPYIEISKEVSLNHIEKRYVNTTKREKQKNHSKRVYCSVDNGIFPVKCSRIRRYTTPYKMTYLLLEPQRENIQWWVKNILSIIEYTSITIDNFKGVRLLQRRASPPSPPSP